MLFVLNHALLRMKLDPFVIVMKLMTYELLYLHLTFRSILVDTFVPMSRHLVIIVAQYRFVVYISKLYPMFHHKEWTVL